MPTRRSAPTPRASWDPWALAFAVFFPSLLTWTYFVALADATAFAQQAVYGVGKAIQFGFPVLFVLLAARERPGRGPGWRRGLVEGCLSGVAILALIVGVWRVLAAAGSPLLADLVPNVSAKIVGLGLSTPVRYAALAVFYSLIHTFLEEYYWRWFVYGRLRRRIGRACATVLSSLGFMAHHVIVMGVFAGWDSPYTYLFSLSVAIGGAYWAWLYERSQNLVAPWVSHLFVDVAIFAVGYALVS